MLQTAADFATTALSGYELLADPQLNKGTAFSEAEREAFVQPRRLHRTSQQQRGRDHAQIDNPRHGVEAFVEVRTLFQGGLDRAG